MSRITIFMYHDIRDLDSSPFPSRYTCKGLISYLSQQRFIDQIEHIRQHYVIISPNDLVEIIASGIIDKNYALLTFDDGLRDHFNVAQILSERQLTGVFFIPIEPIVKRIVMRTHKIQYLIGQIESKAEEFVKELLSNFSSCDRVHIWNTYSKTIWADNHWPESRIFTTNLLRDYPDKIKTLDILNKMFTKYVTDCEELLANDLYLTPGQIEDMACMGMWIGGHGYISENLTNYGITKQEIEIQNTTDFLKSMGFDKLFFSYPNGGYNQITVDLMKRYRYIFGLTTKNLSIETLNGLDMFGIPRLDAPQKLVI